jgi:hypothetical protein
MKSLMANIESTNRELQQNFSAEKLQFAQNQKRNLSLLLNRNKHLFPAFSAEAKGRKDFSPLLKQIQQREIFNNLHLDN